MNIKYTLASLLIALTSQPVFSASNSGINLSEADLINIVNGKISKVPTPQKHTPQQKSFVVAKAVQRQPQFQNPPPARVTPPRSPNLSSIPAWRKPAGHTMTRSADDALFGAAKSRNMKLLRELIAEGANVNHKNFNGETALHIAASLGNLQMVQYLVSQGANIHVRTGTQWMPIHHAMRFDRPRVANYLIAHKASLHHKTIDGFTALDFAKKSKNPHIQAIARRYAH